LPTFDYHAPTALDDVFDLLERYGDDAHLIAGGTALVLLLKQGLIQPAHVVALRGVPELRGIERSPDGGLKLGASSTHRQLERSPEVTAYAQTLADTFGKVATVRIRNQGTLGGNLAHADPAQDPPPMLIALEAEAEVASKSGTRVIPIDEFFVDYFQSVLQPGEVVTSVRLPPLREGTRVHYEKFLPRTQDDYATVSVAAALRLNAQNRCEHVRIALGAAAVTPVRARAVEQALLGQIMTPEAIAAAAALVRDEVDPLADLRGSADYKREMARVWTERTLRRLANAQ
jgi:carbon-monoxide dehydrogenase medium subunit